MRRCMENEVGRRDSACRPAHTETITQRLIIDTHAFTLTHPCRNKCTHKDTQEHMHRCVCVHTCVVRLIVCECVYEWVCVGVQVFVCARLHPRFHARALACLLIALPVPPVVSRSPGPISCSIHQLSPGPISCSIHQLSPGPISCSIHQLSPGLQVPSPVV